MEKCRKDLGSECIIGHIEDIHISLGADNFGTDCTTKFEFGIKLTKTNI